MKIKPKTTVELLLLPSLGALWLGSITTMLELNQKIQGATTYSPWEFVLTIPTMLAGIAATAWCWRNLKDCKEEEPAREPKHYQLAHTRFFTLTACGYLEKDLLKHTNMALRINEVTCSACIMEVWEGVITVNRLAPEPIEIDNLIASKVSPEESPPGSPMRNPTTGPTDNPPAGPKEGLADHLASKPGAL